MKDITKHWRSRDILGTCTELLHAHMDRRASLMLVARELLLASEDNTLEGERLTKLHQLQQKLGVRGQNLQECAVAAAVTKLSDEDVLKISLEIGQLYFDLRAD